MALKKNAKTRNEELSEEIWKELRKHPIIRRDAGKKVTLQYIMKVLDNFVSEITSATLTPDIVARFNKGEVRRELVKEIKGNGPKKIEAVKTLMELDGMKNSTDDIVVVPMHYTDVKGADAESLFIEYTEEQERLMQEDYDKSGRLPYEKD